jgi:beta-mannosidase
LCRLELREGGQVLDRQEFEVGIRTIRTERTAGRQYRTRWGKFQFVLNGKPLFLKGMNWMPVDFLLNCSQEDYRWTLELAKEAGVQMIRVWSGGGFYESDYFYALCDRLGLMVWQDSFLANRDTPNWPQDVLQAQLCLNLYRIRNHPSLAVHSGGNEFNPYSLGNAASMAVVEREIADLDPSRPFFRTTPDQGSAHVYRDMEPVWYRRLYRQLPFLAESGIHSFPNYKSLRRLLSPQELAKPLGDLLAPDFKENHRELLNHFTEYLPQRVIRMLSRASAIERIDGIALPELIEATQMASCEFYQIMVQAMRENYPVTSGIMPWVFRRAWTTVAIQLVDGMGDPIAPYYYLKVAYQPLHILVALENLSYAPGEAVRLPVSVLNENADSSPAEAEICVLSPSLQLVYRHRESLALTGEYKQTFTAPAFVIPEDWEDRFFLIHAALRRDGKLISQSVYWPKALARLKDATLLEKFRTSPQPNLFFDKGPWLKRQIAQATSAILSCELENAQLSAGRASLTVTIRNHAAQYAFPVHLDVTEEGTVCCADDNYFLMSPGEARRLRLKIRFLDEAPTAVHVEIGAWNAAPCRLEAQLA